MKLNFFKESPLYNSLVVVSFLIASSNVVFFPSDKIFSENRETVDII